MQTEKTFLSIVFNPESVGGLLIRLWVAGSIVTVLSLVSLVYGGIR